MFLLKSMYSWLSTIPSPLESIILKPYMAFGSISCPGGPRPPGPPEPPPLAIAIIY